MNKPPLKKTTQNLFVKTGVRLPPGLHKDLHDAALQNGRSLNAEIIARLEAAPITTRLDEIAGTSIELKKMVKQLLEK